MSSVLDRARAHFKSLAQRRIEVPEWGEDGQPLIICWKPWTVAEKRDVWRKAEDDNMLLARIVVAKAEDEQGSKLFNAADVVHLAKGAHDAVVRRVGLAIAADADPLLDAVKDEIVATAAADMGSKAAVEQAAKN